MGTNGSDAIYVGVDLGATNVRAGVIAHDRLGEMSSTLIDSEGSPESVMERMYEVIDAVWTSGVRGIGVGVPSVVDVAEGIVFDVQNIPSMTEVPVKSLLEDRYDRPTFVNNDVNCFVLGEHAFGKARGYRHVAGLNLGTGFAAGLILNGRLFEGANCGAGEIGMVSYGDSTLENHCSSIFFSRRGLDAAETYRRADRGDEAALAVWNEFGRHVGEAVKATLYTYDPEIIVIGGSIRKAYAFFEETMWATVRDFAFRKTLERFRLELSDLEHAPLLGAATLPRLQEDGHT